ncbi:AzlC family ABC transporter permease [Desulfococcaceae bacterium HSG8]|nr:AzlC family ABC transporter permease [Desulfococcaceae bacterium HSG8]
MSSPRSEFISGVKAIAPILLGVVPFATISGVTAVETGMSEIAALGMSFIIFAGAAQLAVVQLIGDYAPAMIIILTALIINLRFAMYSASVAPHFKQLPLKWKALLSYLLTDQAYAVSVVRFNDNPVSQDKHWFFLGAASALWGTWQAGTITGIFLGTRIPESWSLDFAIPLTFTALTVPAIKGQAPVTAAIAAGMASVIFIDLPYNLNIIFAAIVGITAGLLTESRNTGGENNNE